MTNSVVVTSGPITADAATAKVVGIKKTFTVSASATNKVTGLSKAEKKVVKVTKKGKKFTIKGLKAGKATFKIGKKSYTVKVGATTVKAAKTKLTLTKGKAATLKFTTKSGNGDTLTFKASNKNVTLAKTSAKIAKSAASVKATAKKAGKTTITATSKATGKKATVTVTVKGATTPATATPGTSNTPSVTTGAATNTPEATATATATATASGSATNTPDVTATPVATATGSATATPVATGSATNTPEATEVPTEAPTKAPEVVTGGTITVTTNVTGASITVITGTSVIATADATTTTTTIPNILNGVYSIVISKDGYETVTKAVVVNGDVTVDAALEKEADLAVVSSAAVGAKKLAVTFNKPVEDATDATVVVTKGTSNISVSDKTWSEDKKTLTLTLSGKLTTADYKVAFNDLTTTISAEEAKVEKIDITSTNAVLVDANGTVEVYYKVYNQYGEDVTSSEDVTITSNGGANTSTKKGTYKSDYNTLVFNTTTNKNVVITIVHSTGVSASKTLTVVDAAVASDVKIVGVYNEDGLTLSEDNAAEVFYLEVEVKDQYGNTMNPTTGTVTSDLIMTQTDKTVIEAAGTVVGGITNPTITKIPGTTDRYGIALSVTKSGTSNVLLISKNTGKQDTYTLNVEEGVRAYDVKLDTPEYAIAGENVNIPISVTDKDGNEITDMTVLRDAGKGVSVSNGTLTVINGKTYVVLTTPSAGYQTITAQCATSLKVSTLTVQVKDAAKAVAVAGLDADYSTASKGNGTICVNDLVLVDQYGRTLSANSNKTVFDNLIYTNSDNPVQAGDVKVVVSSADTSIFTISGVESGSLTGSTANYTTTKGLTYVANGTGTLHIELQEYKDGNWSTISGSEYETAFTMTDGTNYKSYVVEADDVVYNSGKEVTTSAYQGDITVYGKLNTGAKIALTAGADYSIDAENVALKVDLADGVIGNNMDGSTNKIEYGDDKTKKLDYTITINATGQKFNQSVTFTKEAVAAKSIELESGVGNTYTISAADNSDYNLEALLTTIESGFSTTSTKVYVLDQYGKKTYLKASGNAFADATSGTGMNLTVTFAKVSGTATFSGNGTEAAAIEECSAGSIINATIKVGSASKTFTLTFAGGIDQTAPVATLSNPGTEETTTLTVTFDEAVDTAGLTTNDNLVTSVVGTTAGDLTLNTSANLTWSANKKTLTITIPATTFAADETVTVTFKDGALKDTLGNTVADSYTATVVVE